MDSFPISLRPMDTIAPNGYVRMSLQKKLDELRKVCEENVAKLNELDMAQTRVLVSLGDIRKKVDHIDFCFTHLLEQLSSRVVDLRADRKTTITD